MADRQNQSLKQWQTDGQTGRNSEREREGGERDKVRERERQRERERRERKCPQN